MSELLKPLSHIRRAKGSQFVGQIFWFLSLRSSFTTVDKPENFDPTIIEHLVQPRYTRLLYYFTHAKEMTVLNFNIHEMQIWPRRPLSLPGEAFHELIFVFLRRDYLFQLHFPNVSCHNRP